MKTSFQFKKEQQVFKYKEKVIDDLRNGNRNCTYSALRKIGVGPGDSSSNTFHLPSHVENNLTASQSAELIADHFASISQNYDPINLNNCLPIIRVALSQCDRSVIPRLEEHEVFKKICKSKKPNSPVPGDLPKKLVVRY